MLSGNVHRREGVIARAGFATAAAKEVRGGGEAWAPDGPTACVGLDVPMHLRDAVPILLAKVQPDVFQSRGVADAVVGPLEHLEFMHAMEPGER